MSTEEALSTIVNESIPSESQKDHEVSKDFNGLTLSSQTVHADDSLNTYDDVAPALHVSTTFRYSKDPDSLVPFADMEVCYLLPLFIWLNPTLNFHLNFKQLYQGADTIHSQTSLEVDMQATSTPDTPPPTQLASNQS